MGIEVNSSAVYDGLVSLIDTINQERDPLLRLALFSYLADLYEKRVLTERNACAYEARQRYAMENITQVTGSEPKQVYFWADTHRKRNALPTLPRRLPQDVSGAVEIASAYRRRNPAFRDRGDMA